MKYKASKKGPSLSDLLEIEEMVKHQKGTKVKVYEIKNEKKRG